MQVRAIGRSLYYRLFWGLFHARAASLLRGLARPLPLLRRFPVYGQFTRRFDGIAIRYAASPRDLIGRDVFWSGVEAVEPETLRFVAPRIGPDTLFIDVGANTGLYTLLAGLKGAAHVVAFEPVPAIFARLERNVACNGLAGRCTLMPAAAAAEDGEAPFSVPFGDVFPTSAQLGTRGQPWKPGARTTVPTHRLDSVVAALPDGAMRGVRRLLVKIDVEGFELDVLQGFTRSLAERRVELVFEANRPADLAPVRAFLAERGYEVAQITPEGLVPADRARFDLSPRCRNFFASRPAVG